MPCKPLVTISSLLLLLLFCVPKPIFAQSPPQIDWVEAETEHYYVIYDAKQKDLAELYALKAEVAYETLKPYFPHIPEKIVLVVNDSTDSANGFATPFPRPMIQVFPIHPTPFDSINYYGDWEYELLIHELGHIAQLTDVSGFWKPLRYILGSIVTPMALVPRWYLEGMSVDIETRFSEHGRLRSPYFGANVRAFVRDGVWGNESLGSMNEQSIPSWPYGQRPYFYGGILMSEVSEQEDFKSIKTLNSRHAARFPGFYSGAPVKAYSKSYGYYLRSAYMKWDLRAKDQLEKIRSVGSTKGKEIESKERIYLHSPQLSPDGRRLAYIKTSLHDDSTLIVRKRKNTKDSFAKSKEESLTSADAIRGFTWVGKNKIIVDKVGTHDRFFTFSDLYEVNVKKEKTKQLTKGKRLRYPTISDDRKTIYAIQGEGSKTQIVSLNRKGEILDTLYRPKRTIRLSHPVYLSDRELLFVGKVSTGNESIYILNPKTKKVRKLNGVPKEARLPQRAGAGVIFQSTQSGTGNLYYWNKNNGEISPITNSETLAVNGTYDSGRRKLIISELNSDGYRIVELEKGLETTRVAKISNYEPNKVYEPVKTSEVTSQSKLEDEGSYWGSSYLFPQYWFPIFSLITGPSGGVYTYLGANTGGSDPVGHHSYSLSGAYDSLVNRPNGFFSYYNNQTPLSLFLVGVDTKDYLFGTDTFQHNTSGLLGSSFYIWGLSNSYRGTLAWTYSQSQVEDIGILIQQGPSVSVNYSSVEQKGLQISPESGGRFYTEYTKYLKDKNSIEYELIRAGGALYYSGFLPKRHAVFLRTDNSFTPRNRSIFLGTFVGGGEFGGLIDYTPRHLVRGYPVGEFIGWRMNSANFEYRFPIQYKYSDFGTSPLFIRRWHGAITFDTLQLEGGYYSFENGGSLIEANDTMFFSSAGVEARADSTVFHGLPVTFRIGAHYGFETDAYGGFYYFLGVGTIN